MSLRLVSRSLVACSPGAALHRRASIDVGLDRAHGFHFDSQPATMLKIHTQTETN